MKRLLVVWFTVRGFFDELFYNPLLVSRWSVAILFDRFGGDRFGGDRFGGDRFGGHRFGDRFCLGGGGE